MKNNEMKGIILMLIASLIWSFSTVMIKTAIDDLGPWTFNAVRSFLGAMSMVPLVYMFDLKLNKNGSQKLKLSPAVWRDSVALGVVIGSYMVLAQTGMAYTTIGKTGFITALYIIIVPVLGIFLHRKQPLRIWFCVAVALMGFYLMSMTEGFSSINKGDVLIFIGAIFCAFQIYLIDSLAKRISPMLLTCFQFLFAGIFCMTGAFIFEQPSIDQIMNAIVPLLYTGIVSCGIGYMIQAFGQKFLDPVKASFLFSSETIFTMILGFLVFHEIMSAREYIGCALIFFAIIYSLIEPKDQRREHEQ